MPIYEYKCKECQQLTEVIQSFSEKPLTDCPKCNKVDSLEKNICVTAPPKFKGSGFYVNDYPKGKIRN